MYTFPVQRAAQLKEKPDPKTLVFGNPVAGYPTIVCLILLIGGLLMFFIGVLGQYMSKTYLETKSRPAYVVRETEEGLK